MSLLRLNVSTTPVNPMSRRLFIGDVHGQYTGLKALMSYVKRDPGDELYFVGDLIDRGPGSAHVVEYVMHHATGCVLGNHEQLLMEAVSDLTPNSAALQSWLYSGGQATLSSYRSTAQLQQHLDWFYSLPLYLDLGDVWLVHAGLDPRKPIARQSSSEFCWIRDPFHNSPTPYFSNKLIITGHTITFTFPDAAPGQLVEGPGWLNIDTGAYHPKSGWLTALDLDNEQVYQVNVYTNARRCRSLEEAVSPFTGARSPLYATAC